MMFLGAKYCSHCGAKADRTVAETAKVRLCPRCQVNTQVVAIGESNLRECPRCEGLWADVGTLQEICTNREQQSAVLGAVMTITPPQSSTLEKVRYVPCPVCKNLMHRVNFARCSAVIVDVCKPHGTWFDKDELRRIVEFIRAGGFERARASEIAELERQRRSLETARAAAAGERSAGYYPANKTWEPALLEAGASLLTSFFD
jgi:Zn-finger nucleic acid-binding protein